VVHALAQTLLDQIRRTELTKPGDRLGVAVSGGADSTALLRLLLELRDQLGIVLSVVHFNHELRGAESDSDERFVAELAHRHDLEFRLHSGDTGAYAREKQLSLEAAARDLRYAYFAQLASPDARGAVQLDKVATAHTLDDQAETVLMRMIRGTGLRGLGGIYPRMVVEGENSEEASETAAEIIRPLLGVRRRELEAYLREIRQDWREDATNRDPHFTRNRVRAQLLPLLEREFNPSITQNLSELADIARTEEDYWDNEVAGWVGTGIHWTEPEWARAASGQSKDLVQLRAPDPDLARRLEEPGPLVMNASVDLLWLHSEAHAVQRRIVKAVGELAGFPLEFRHVDEILEFANHEANAGKRLSLPLGWQVERRAQELLFLTPDLRTRPRIPEDYTYSLPVPGRVMIPEAGIAVEALMIPAGSDFAGYNRDQLLDAALVSKQLGVRNWRPGDRFWPAHTKAPKKIKELLQERHISGEEKKRWPIVVSGDQVIWLRGFAVSAALQPKPDAIEAILLRDRALDEE
jgi:tRNA(Ile)-lysidine synthase